VASSPALARLVLNNPQVLVLDEPTNHLDIPAREALEEALTLFGGSILIVSHDRYFLDRVADRLLVLPRRGQYEIIDGNWSTYSAILTQREEAQRAEQHRQKDQERKAREAREAAAPKKKSRSKYAAHRVEELEARIIEFEGRLKQMETSFADPALLKDAEKSKRLHEEYHSLKADLVSLNRQWEEAIEAQAN
jgi:ATP-binding cassette subfamily F protein 3